MSYRTPLSRPPFGIALLGFWINAFRFVFRILPHLVFLGMLSVPVWHLTSPPQAAQNVQADDLGEWMHTYSYHAEHQPHNHKFPIQEVQTQSSGLSVLSLVMLFVLSLPTAAIFQAACQPIRECLLENCWTWFFLGYVEPARQTGIWPELMAPVVVSMRESPYVPREFVEFVELFNTETTAKRAGNHTKQRARKHATHPSPPESISDSVFESSEPETFTLPTPRIRHIEAPENLEQYSHHSTWSSVSSSDQEFRPAPGKPRMQFPSLFATPPLPKPRIPAAVRDFVLPPPPVHPQLDEIMEQRPYNAGPWTGYADAYTAASNGVDVNRPRHPVYSPTGWQSAANVETLMMHHLRSRLVQEAHDRLVLEVEPDAYYDPRASDDAQYGAAPVDPNYYVQPTQSTVPGMPTVWDPNDARYAQQQQHPVQELQEDWGQYQRQN